VNRQAALDIQLEVIRGSPDISMTIDKSVTPPKQYDGTYEPVPILYDELVLPTAHLLMTKNVRVQPITIYEVSNPKGGRTVTIGMVGD